MRQLSYVVSALKNLLVITVGAILGFKIVNQRYDVQSMVYFTIGLVGFTFLTWLEENMKNA